MPRPKVQPENRQRVTQACTNCKASKRKCNAELPCSHCARRGVGESCRFLSSDPSTRSSSSRGDGNLQNNGPFAPTQNGRESSGAMQAREVHNSNGNSNKSKDNTAQSRNNSRSHVTYSDSTQLPEQSPDFSSTSTSRGQALNATKPRMLSSSTGERVFVGGSASLSFLQLVRETVSKCIGASDFSDYAARDHMLEIDDPDISGGVSSLGSIKQDDCIDRYFLATTGILDVVNRQEVKSLIGDLVEDNLRKATGYLVIAIGAQTSPSSSDNDLLQIEKACFRSAQKLAFVSMLENPSLEMVRTFSLLSFYLLGACRRNAAFMYLGVAARAAHALGMHAESYKALNADQRLPRLRYWKSLVCLDIVVCSILGRASATISTRKLEVDGGETPLQNIESLGPELEAGFRLSNVVNAVLEEFYTLKVMTVEAAESHIERLREWSDTLPQRLRLTGLPQSEIAQETVLSSLQVSCFYYFAVMLVTRPFLISNLTNELKLTEVRDDTESRREQPENGSGSNSQPSFRPHSNTTYDTDDGSVTDLASACLSAAVFMVQTCADALHLDFLLDNMCLVKAWVFTAGLVLGFHIFATKEPDKEVEDALESAQEVLKKFSARSPQAAHYLDILGYLSHAIEKQKLIQKSRKRKRTTSLVSRIVNLQPPIHSTILENHAQSYPHAGGADQGLSLNDSNAIFQLDPQLLQQNMDMENMFYGWDGTYFGIDDQFSAETRDVDETSWMWH